MLRAKPAAVPIRNSTRAKTGCTLSPATRADRVVRWLPLRRVSVDKLVAERDRVEFLSICFLLGDMMVEKG